MVEQGDNIGQVLDGRHNRCIELQWGGWWRPFGHSGKLKDEARGFWLPSEEGMSSNAQELSAVKLAVKASLEHFRI